MLYSRATRGYGVLEKYLSEKRGRKADKLISSERRKGRILDIGCGGNPIFLKKVKFQSKYGLDKIDKVNDERFIEKSENSIRFFNQDLDENVNLPFGNEFFDVITMLAVFEHIDPQKLPELLNEIFRILKPSGIYILTTPAPWAKYLLIIMAKLKLVSSIEIEEHKGAYSKPEVFSLLENAGFSKNKLHSGYFEMFMNIWATGIKW